MIDRIQRLTGGPPVVRGRFATGSIGLVHGISSCDWAVWPGKFCVGCSSFHVTLRLGCARGARSNSLLVIALDQAVHIDTGSGLAVGSRLPVGHDLFDLDKQQTFYRTIAAGGFKVAARPCEKIRLASLVGFRRLHNGEGRSKMPSP